jgi:N-alpha-acetyltransferase 40
MKGQGGGGIAKGGGKTKTKSSGGNVKVMKSKSCPTSPLEGTVLKLRAALFDEQGKDKNVLVGIAPSFLAYQRNDLNVQVEFAASLLEDQLDWAFELTRKHMEEVYDRSGYGWDDADKERELTEEGARFLLLKDVNSSEYVGYAHFRFTVQGEVVDQMVGDSCLHVVDLHIEADYQRKGLGKHLLLLMELISRRERLSRVSLPCYLGDTGFETFLSKQKGYLLDESCALFGFDADVEVKQLSYLSTTIFRYCLL